MLAETAPERAPAGGGVEGGVEGGRAMQKLISSVAMGVGKVNLLGHPTSKISNSTNQAVTCLGIAYSASPLTSMAMSAAQVEGLSERGAAMVNAGVSWR
jgi:hypothetical protein